MGTLTDIFSKRKKQPNNMHDHWGLPGLDQRPDTPAEPDADDAAPGASDCDSGSESSSSMSSTGAYEREHEWLPEGKYWGPSAAENDQRLFDGDHLKPAVRQDLLRRFAMFCSHHQYDGYKQWARVYFAGSQASKFLTEGRGNGDFDILVGINYEIFKNYNPAYFGRTGEEISQQLTAQMHQELNNPDYHPPIG